MTLDEILSAIRISGVRWRLIHQRASLGCAPAIRTVGRGTNGRCPVEVARRKVLVGYATFPVGSPERGVVEAADGAPGHDPDVRRLLIEACGLTENA